MAPNLAAIASARTGDEPRRGPAGELQLVFLARLHPKKNLLFLLEALRTVEAAVHLDIAGPLEDAGYWARCRRALTGLPANVRVTIHGAVAPDDVDGLLGRCDVFALPTVDENFGHAVLEALAAGCFVLLSPHTPWTDIDAAGVGRTLPLGDGAPWSAAIAGLAAGIDGDSSRRGRARAYAARHLADEEPARRLERLLVDAAAGSAGG